MAFLEAKQIRGHTYYYLIERARVNGVSKKVRTVYLGTAEGLAAKVLGQRPCAGGPLRLKSFPFGPLAALWREAEQLDLVATIDHYARKRPTPGLSVGQYLLLTILARSLEPWSKAATGRWFDRDCFLRFLWKVPHRVDSHNILANLRHLSERAVQHRIEHAVAEKLVAQGFRPRRLFWDLTNYSTYIEEGEELPQPGHAKDRRYDLNLVGTALAVTEEHIPLLHETVPGNADECEVFAEAVESLTTRLLRLNLDPSSMVLVIDRGPNSNENLWEARGLMHVVGAIPPQLVPDLMQLDLGQFAPLYTTEKGHPLLGCRTQREVYGQSFTVVVTYNAATAKRKALTYERYERRFREGMAKIQAGYERAHGRRLSFESAAAEAAELVPSQYRSVFRYVLHEDTHRLTWEVNTEAKARLLQRFGRRAFFTDLEGDAATIARTYEERYKVEQDFRWLKGDEVMPFAPLFVRNDASIRAHAFLVVVGLLLWRLLWKRIRDLGITAPEEEVLTALNELRLSLVGDQQRGVLRSGRWVVEQHSTLAEELFRKLDLSRAMPA